MFIIQSHSISTLLSLGAALFLSTGLTAVNVNASPLSSSSSSSSSSRDLVSRAVRCDFPGKLFNNNLAISMNVRYDSSSGQKVSTVPPNQNSTQFSCDTDFVQVDGYTLIVDDTTIGPYKNRDLATRTTLSGAEYKLDAYSLFCAQDLDVLVPCPANANANVENKLLQREAQRRTTTTTTTSKKKKTTSTTKKHRRTSTTTTKKHHRTTTTTSTKKHRPTKTTKKTTTTTTKKPTKPRTKVITLTTISTLTTLTTDTTTTTSTDLTTATTTATATTITTGTESTTATATTTTTTTATATVTTTQRPCNSNPVVRCQVVYNGNQF